MPSMSDRPDLSYIFSTDFFLRKHLAASICTLLYAWNLAISPACSLFESSQLALFKYLIHQKSLYNLGLVQSQFKSMLKQTRPLYTLLQYGFMHDVLGFHIKQLLPKSL